VPDQGSADVDGDGSLQACLVKLVAALDTVPVKRDDTTVLRRWFMVATDMADGKATILVEVPRRFAGRLGSDGKEEDGGDDD